MLKDSQSHNQKDSIGRIISNEAARPLYQDLFGAALLGLIVNFFLGGIKLIGGLASNSFALIADAINSLGDVLTSAAVLLAIRFAQKPPDLNHPYGHTRAEAIAGVNVALLLVVSAIWIAGEALSRFFLEHEVPPAWTLWIAGSNVAIKEALYHYKVRIAKRTGSSAILAHAWDHRADAFSAFAALIGLSVIRLGGTDFIWADEVAALIIVAAILFSSLKLFSSAASELMDAQADTAFVEQVKQDALSIKGVLGVETLWIRKSGLEYLADIHLEVDPKITVREGHAISHIVRDHLLHEHTCLRDVLVHLEPYSEED
ncbi:MAG: cation transporter [Bdellovibrionales bacterium]|nr:cation transporter [Bdellovibrionales bacterium]